MKKSEVPKSMKPEHVFIFSDRPHEVAEELIAFGLIEGSGRVHPNQGTRNRKFYFKDFYIEILWVHSVEEITSPLTAPTGLYECSRYKESGYSPFGLCVAYREVDDAIFKDAFDYLPREILPSENYQRLNFFESCILW